MEGIEARLRNLAVLCVLAVDREVTRDRLAGLIWPDRAPKRAYQSLSQAFYELGKALGTGWVAKEGATYRALPPLQSDAHEFHRATEEGRVDEAVALYGGHFLHGFSSSLAEFEFWSEGVARDLLGRFRVAAGETIRRRQDSGDVPGALLCAERWCELSPADDEAVHFLIALLGLAGDRASAIRAFDSYGARLREDGLEPLDRTKALVDAVREGDHPRVRSLFSLDQEAAARTMDRNTRPWWPKRRTGPRLVLIREPQEVEGDQVALARAVTTVGAEGDVPVEPLTGGPRILARLERDPVDGSAILRPDPEGGTGQVYAFAPGPRLLRPGDRFRVGRQLFTLVEDDT